MTDDSGFLVFSGIGLFFDSPFFCGLTMRIKFITLCFLSVFSLSAYAEIKKAPIGNTHLNAEFDRSGFDKLMNKSFDVDKMVQRYESNAQMKADIRGSANQVSATKVDVNIKASVARKDVFKNLFANAKKGGRLLGAAGWLWMAYDLLNPILVDGGWVYDPDEKNWVRYKNYGFAYSKKQLPLDGSRYIEDVCGSVGCDVEHTFSMEVYSMQKLESEADKACGDVPLSDEKLGSNLDGSYYKETGKPYYSGHSYAGLSFSCSVDVGYFDKDGVLKSKSKGSKGAVVLYRTKNGKEAITQSEVDELLAPHADKNPPSFVSATANERGQIPDLDVSDKVQIEKGTVVQTNPYTNVQTGQTEQTTWEFGRDASGQTTVKETVTPRPDLSPNSVEAPKTQESTATDFKTETQTGSQTQSGSQTQTGSKTQSDSETQSGSKTQDGTQTKEGTQGGSSPASNTGGKTESSGDKEDTKDKGFLCDLFPDILACDKLPDAGEDPELEIPSEVVNVEFQKMSVFQETGQCPEPVLFEVNVMGASKTFGFSFEHVCSVAERIRFALIMFAWLVAAFWCLRTVSGDK